MLSLAAAQQSFAPSYEFAQVERLGEVVVRTCIQQLDTTSFSSRAVSTSTGVFSAFAAQPGQHFQSVQPGQHEVEHQQVVRISAGQK